MVIKWGKRLVTTVCLGIVGLLLYALSYYVYWDWYIPYHTESLYQEAIQNPNKSEEIAQQLFDMEDHTSGSNDKALKLITYYAEKGRIGSQKMLEQYNADNGLPIESKIPINRHIFGIDLGKSTKQDVWNYLDCNSLQHQELENGSITQCYNDFEFAGVYWDYACFYYVNNKVYKITFTYSTKGSALECFNALKGMLVSKYTLSKKINIENSSNFYIKDSNTLIELDLNFHDLCLKYTDVKAKKEKLQNDLKNI